jgi:hypothetical protein
MPESSRPTNKRGQSSVPLYAVIRFDTGMDSVGNGVTVKEVLPTLDEAKDEVARLNAAAPPGTTYFWQTTRYYPDGRHTKPT